MCSRIREDIQCVCERDPAARTVWEVLTCYPGFHALQLHRFSHGLWTFGLKWLARLSSQRTELHVRSVFLQGLLLMPDRALPRVFDRWAPLWMLYDRWLSDANLTPLQACLRYSSSFPQINKVIIGVDSVAQMADILKAADGPAPVVPSALGTDDADLLNPGRWHAHQL